MIQWVRNMDDENEKCCEILEEAKKSLNSKYKFGTVKKHNKWIYYLEINDSRLPFIKRIYLGEDNGRVSLIFYPADTAEQARPLFEKVAISRAKFLDVLKQLAISGYKIETNPHVGFITTGYHPFKTYTSFKDNNEEFLKYLNYFISNIDKIRGGYADMEEISEVAKSIWIEFEDNYKTDSSISNIRTYERGDKKHSTGLSFRPGFKILYAYEEELDPETYKNDVFSKIDNVLTRLISI